MKLFEKISEELTPLEPELSGEDAYFWLEKVSKEGGLNTGSWAIWDPKETRNTKFVKENSHLAKPQFMVLGMNQSKKVGKDGIFHTENASEALANSFLPGGPLNKYYGAYLTDLLNLYDMDTKKLIYEPDSKKLIEFFEKADTKKNKPAADYTKQMFLNKYNKLKEAAGFAPKVLAMSGITFRFAKLWLPKGADVTRIRHSSNVFGNQDKYNSTVALDLVNGDFDKLDKKDQEVLQNIETLRLANKVNFLDLIRRIEFYETSIKRRRLDSSDKTRFDPLLQAAADDLDMVNTLKAGYPAMIKDKLYKPLQLIIDIKDVYDKKVSFHGTDRRKDSIKEGLSTVIDKLLSE